MDITAELDAPCAPDVLHPWIDDLASYPQWLTIVPRAVALDAADGDRGPAWSIDLRGKVGPLSRSKRLRMVRSTTDAHEVVFERRELDGQTHAAWILRAKLTPIASGTNLIMELHYSGRLWEPLVERLLRDEIDRSKARLLALLA
jgi:hypothetical protein